MVFGTLPELLLHTEGSRHVSFVQATGNFAEVQTIGAKDVLQLRQEGEG